MGRGAAPAVSPDGSVCGYSVAAPRPMEVLLPHPCVENFCGFSSIKTDREYSLRRAIFEGLVNNR